MSLWGRDPFEGVAASKEQPGPPKWPFAEWSMLVPRRQTLAVVPPMPAQLLAACREGGDG